MKGLHVDDVIVKLYTGEKEPHEAKGTMELKGPIKAREPATVKGPTERKLKFFSLPLSITSAYSNLKRNVKSCFFLIFLQSLDFFFVMIT